MNSRSLASLMLLNDLRHAALDAFDRKHKQPSLLLLYCFIDICATLADEGAAKTNRARFERFLQRYARPSSLRTFSTYDLWAARCSILHAYSPLGQHTAKRQDPARALFYYCWPENQEQVREMLQKRGYHDFVLLDIAHIKAIAIDTFNSMWTRVDEEPAFEVVLQRNAENLLRDSHHMELEDALLSLERFANTGPEAHD